MLVEITDESVIKYAEAFNAPANPVKYLGIDPGKSNGICGYDSNYYLLFMYTVKSEDMVRFLKIFERVEKCIVEDFVLYPNKARDQIYSDMETSRIIGRIESWAENSDIQVIKQKATIKKTGYLWIGAKPLPKSNPHNHEWDAHVHFMYWALKTGHVPANRVLKPDAGS